jgi:hypothetical protein
MSIPLIDTHGRPLKPAMPMFPLELLTLIVSYAGISTLAALTRVSRQLLDLASPLLYQHLVWDLNHSRPNPDKRRYPINKRGGEEAKSLRIRLLAHTHTITVLAPKSAPGQKGIINGVVFTNRYLKPSTVHSIAAQNGFLYLYPVLSLPTRDVLVLHWSPRCPPLPHPPWTNPTSVPRRIVLVGTQQHTIRLIRAMAMISLFYADLPGCHLKIIYAPSAHTRQNSVKGFKALCAALEDEHGPRRLTLVNAEGFSFRNPDRDRDPSASTHMDDQDRYKSEIKASLRPPRRLYLKPGVVFSDWLGDSLQFMTMEEYLKGPEYEDELLEEELVSCRKAVGSEAVEAAESG